MDAKGRIAVILPQVSSNTETGFIDTIHREACRYGYDTIVITGAINYVDQHLEGTYSKGQRNIYDLILQGDFDGFIYEANLFCSVTQRELLLDILREKDRPCVTVNYEQPYFPSVSADERLPLYLSARHLIKEHGCRKLYCIGGNKGHKPSEERIEGFRRAMDEAGLEYDESCIFYGDYWRDIPHRIALDIAEGRLERPDGIVCGSDIMAVELCRTLLDNGVRVPEDIKITGCDGSVISQSERVTITTVAGQERINGVLAVNKLMELMGEKTDSSDMQPELIIGESCGCGAEKGKAVNESLSDIREYTGTIFELLEHRKTNSHGEIIRRMSECKDIYDVIGVFMGCCYMIPTGIRAELCLCEDWCRDMNDPSVFRTKELPDRMILGIEACPEGGDKMKEFMTRDVFPSLKKRHEPRLTVVTSLHYKGQIFGYVGFTYRKAVHIVLDEFYMSWCDAVSSGLNTVQNRMYKDYVNKRIESLSEFAPVLGIYNKRGLISKLMNMIAENSNSVLNLTLLSYVREDRVRYSVPPINTIVNAIRLSDPQAVLASVGEDMIAVVKQGETAAGDPSEKVVQAVTESYRGAVEIKRDRIVFHTERVSAVDIFSIEKLISGMEDRLKGRMISFGSGTFSYRDSFTSLRDEIFRHPEKEWNIEQITRSIGLSKSHFHRIYKELFDTNCKDDIISSRMEKAKWLLENTSLSVSQISEQCGYSNNSHFIRQFSSRMGMTPSAYRKRNGQKKQIK